MANIRILTTGGTIDKVYFDAKSEYQVGAPSVEQILIEGGVTTPYEIESVLRKDSLEMTHEDRILVRERIASCAERKVLVTHGTDTLVESARMATDIAGKAVVFTGALQPAGFKFTDAVFNVACALGVLLATEEGVFVVMGGQTFRPDEVRKNVAANRFERI